MPRETGSYVAIPSSSPLDQDARRDGDDSDGDSVVSLTHIEITHPLSYHRYNNALTFLFIHLFAFFLPLGFLLLLLGLFLTGQWIVGAVILGPYLMLYCDRREFKLGWPQRWFAESFFLRTVYEYFPGSLRRLGPKFPADRNYVFAVHPHGVMAINRLIFSAQKERYWNRLFPSIQTRDLTATSAFCVPILREMFLWAGFVDAGRKTASNVLRNGLSVMLYPGGIAEQMECIQGKEVVFLKNRKGFIKLALEHGAPIVPCYVFGDADLYRTSRFMLDQRKLLSRTYRMSALMFWGRFFLLPYKVPLVAVVGQPLPVGPANANPTDAEIDHVHVDYVAALTNLFDTFKDDLGYSDRELIIL